MTTNLGVAFDTLEARANATAKPEYLDRISLRDHIVEVEIGAFQSERGTTQRICFNVVVEVLVQPKPLEDDVDRILSYDAISDAIKTELAAERLNLLETLAARVAERILDEPQAERVFVRIEKLDRGPGALGVEIVRSKKDKPDAVAATPDLKQDLPIPLIVWFSNEAIVSSNLSGWLDTLQKSKRPAVLCVGASEYASPASAVAEFQRHIDLLAIEQNAWVLAGLDRRCTVVGTRTEMDWAIRNGHISVWAPSKMILDAVDGPRGKERGELAFPIWLAAALNAEQLVVVGGAVDLESELKITVVDPSQPVLL